MWFCRSELFPADVLIKLDAGTRFVKMPPGPWMAGAEPLCPQTPQNPQTSHRKRGKDGIFHPWGAGLWVLVPVLVLVLVPVPVTVQPCAAERGAQKSIVMFLIQADLDFILQHVNWTSLFQSSYRLWEIGGMVSF